MRRFRKFLVAFFCALILSIVGMGHFNLGMNEVEANNSYYNISFNPYYGMYQADFHGTSKDMLGFCLLDLYFNYGGGGIISLNDDILSTSHLDISDGRFVILGNGHSFIYSGPSYIFVALDNMVKVSGNADVSFQGVTFNGQGFCYSSLGLPGSILELVSGNPTLTLSECIVCNSRNMTAFDRSKPLGGGTGINAWYGTLNCTDTVFYNISGACIYESEGGNPYSNGRCNVTLNNCSSHDVSSLFSSGESVGCSHSLTINGGDFHCGGDSEYVTYSLAIDFGNVTTDNTYASINNADIYCDGGMTIANKGEMSILSSDISAKYLFAAVVNNNKMKIDNSKLHDSGVGIYNNASLNIYSGSIYNNSGYGIFNDGEVVQSGGNVHSNGGDTPEGKIGGVFQNGTYNIKDRARIGSNNSVLLIGSHVIDVDYKYMDMHYKSTLNNYSPIVITLESNERFIGRKLVNVINGSESYADRYNSLFVLGFTNVMYNNDRSGFNGVKNSASIRPGSSIYNCELNSLYLSGRYFLYYDNSFDGFNKTRVVYNRAYDEFYWLENANIDFSTINYDVLCSDKPVTNSFILESFVIDDKSYPIINTHFTDRQMWDNNRTCKGVFCVRFNMNFDGNGGKTIDNRTGIIEYSIDNSFVFPEYVFMRDRVKGVRNSLINNHSVTQEFDYSQQGWNTRRDATYRDVDTIRKNTSISNIAPDLTMYLLSFLEEDKAIIKDEFATIEFYAVWDEYPVIDNIDIAIPIEDISKVDEGYIIDKAKVVSRDREDGDNVLIGIEGFDGEELSRLDVSEGITLNISSIDLVGNVSYKPITIRISSTKPITRRTTIRYFDMDYIDSIEEEGGLMDNSKWFNLLK